jgi:EamA domain-containing membrane protein RarD
MLSLVSFRAARKEYDKKTTGSEALIESTYECFIIEAVLASIDFFYFIFAPGHTTRIEYAIGSEQVGTPVACVGVSFGKIRT